MQVSATTKTSVLHNLLERCANNASTNNSQLSITYLFVTFTAGKDSTNHVVADSEDCDEVIDITVKRLDDIVGGRTPAVIKIDVEGWESNVIEGAQNVLSQTEPLALLIEFGLGTRYGFDENQLYQKILAFGFERVSYNPLRRKLTPTTGTAKAGGNILFIKQLAHFQERVELAPKYEVFDLHI